jgi:hypothetical protein
MSFYSSDISNSLTNSSGFNYSNSLYSSNDFRYSPSGIIASSIFNFIFSYKSQTHLFSSAAFLGPVGVDGFSLGFIGALMKLSLF